MNDLSSIAVASILLVSYSFLVRKFYFIRAELSPLSSHNLLNLNPLFPEETDADEDDEVFLQHNQFLCSINKPSWWNHYFKWFKIDKATCHGSMVDLRKASTLHSTESDI